MDNKGQFGMVGIFLMGLLLIIAIGVGAMVIHYAMSDFVNPILTSTLNMTTYQNATELAESQNYMTRGYMFYMTSFIILFVAIILWVIVNAFRRKQQYGEQ